MNGIHFIALLNFHYNSLCKTADEMHSGSTAYTEAMRNKYHAALRAGLDEIITSAIAGGTFHIFSSAVDVHESVLSSTRRLRVGERVTFGIGNGQAEVTEIARDKITVKLTVSDPAVPQLVPSSDTITLPISAAASSDFRHLN
jgi:hypothetical protein